MHPHLSNPNIETFPKDNIHRHTHTHQKKTTLNKIKRKVVETSEREKRAKKWQPNRRVLLRALSPKPVSNTNVRLDYKHWGFSWSPKTRLYGKRCASCVFLGDSQALWKLQFLLCFRLLPKKASQTKSSNSPPPPQKKKNFLGSD